MRVTKAVTAVIFFMFLTSVVFADSQIVINLENGHAYQRFDTPYFPSPETGGIDWYSANTLAQGLTYNGFTGHLATVTSEAENQWIIDNLGGARTLDHWLGGYRESENGNWFWVTGEPWEYEAWGPGEPSGDCCGLQYDDAETPIPILGWWNDMPQYRLEEGYIVEFDVPVPIPATVWLLGTGLLGVIGLRRKVRK